jgi:hypothetical protein
LISGDEIAEVPYQSFLHILERILGPSVKIRDILTQLKPIFNAAFLAASNAQDACINSFLKVRDDSLKLHATDVIIPSKIKKEQGKHLINNNNLQGTQYNKKRLRSWFLMEKQLPETLLEPEVIAEMVLKRALEDYAKAQIEKQIDDSLKNRNKFEFFRLTNELKRTHKMQAELLK